MSHGHSNDDTQNHSHGKGNGHDHGHSNGHRCARNSDTVQVQVQVFTVVVSFSINLSQNYGIYGHQSLPSHRSYVLINHQKSMMTFGHGQGHDILSPKFDFYYEVRAPTSEI